MPASVAAPVDDHARLAQRERHEDAHDVQLDQPGDRSVERDDQHGRDRGQDHDAVAEHEPVPTTCQLLGQEPILSEDRGQDRESVERRVRSQHQDQCGEALDA